MKTKVHKLIFFLIAAVICCAVALYWLEEKQQGVVILAYHKVDASNDQYSINPAEFEKHMAYLADNGYNPISLEEMMEGFEGLRELPHKPVVITFDDGYKDNLVTALPIMEKYHMKATVFVLAGSIGQPDYLEWPDIQMMLRRGTEIGSHTVSHQALSELAPVKQIEELTASKAILEQGVSRSIVFLAYPYGAYNKQLPVMLAETGYRGACTGVTGLNTAKTNPYLLKRVNIPQPRWGITEFKLRIWRARLVALVS